MPRTHRLPSGLLLLLLLPATPAIAFDAVWNATAGAVPDSACPPWTHSFNAAPSVLAGGVLELATTVCSANNSYSQTGADIAIPDTVIFEGRLSLVSGSECVGPCGSYRQAAMISIATAPSVGILCFVAPGGVMMTSGCAPAAVAGASTSGSHLYRVEVLPTGVVRFYQDGNLKLTGATYTSAPDHGSNKRITWGEASSFAYGTSRWESVRHNAHATGCPTTAVEPAREVGAGAARGFAHPNPFRGTTRLHLSVDRRGPVRIDIHDILGRRVRTIEVSAAEPGSVSAEWDGNDEAGRPLPSGTYAYRIRGGSRAQSGTALRLQ